MTPPVTSTRDRILDGAAEVMRAKGLAHTTTKEIARASGYSEATLYKLFTDKVDLFLCVLMERLPQIALVRDELSTRVGHGEVIDTLREAAEQMLDFYTASFPISASVFADADLLVRHRDGVLSRGAGPVKVNHAIADYLRAEQHAGRVADDVRPDAVAAALAGACFQRAFLTAFTGETPTRQERSRWLSDLLATVLRP